MERAMFNCYMQWRGFQSQRGECYARFPTPIYLPKFKFDIGKYDMDIKARELDLAPWGILPLGLPFIVEFIAVGVRRTCFDDEWPVMRLERFVQYAPYDPSLSFRGQDYLESNGLITYLPMQKKLTSEEYRKHLLTCDVTRRY